MTTFERRMAVTDLKFRDNSDTFTLTGYASTFNQPYDMGWYTESVDPKAFQRTLGRTPDVRLLINHDGLPLARTTSGTLMLDTDSRGLLVVATLDPNDPDVQRLAPKMARGDMNQMSFGFRTISDVWSDNMSKRSLNELDLNDGDVSVVTYPANPGTSATIRSEGHPLEALTFALAALESRGASPEDVVSVLTRALGYFTAIDNIVDSAQEELAEVLNIPNPDADDASSMTDDGQGARQAALAIAEARSRALRLLG